MSREAAAEGLLRFLEETYDATEVLWCAGLAMLERATIAAREDSHGRFRNNPGGALRRFRRDAEAGSKLLELAVELQQADDERDRELVDELHERAVQAGKDRRRAQTLPAERARLAKLAARQASTST